MSLPAAASSCGRPSVEAMSGAVCLQGGAEFSPGCAAMDAQLLRLAGGPVAVTALAAAPGAQYRQANAGGVAHYSRLGANAVDVPDVREDCAGALAALADARVLVLPGGSPARLLAALADSPVGQVVLDLHAAGGLVVGSSAGAMVLCGWTVLPDRVGPPGTAVVPGLDVVPRMLVLPHYQQGQPDWLRAVDARVPPDTVVLGLPEESGVLVRDRTVTALGQAPSRLVREERDLAPGMSWQAP